MSQLKQSIRKTATCMLLLAAPFAVLPAEANLSDAAAKWTIRVSPPNRIDETAIDNIHPGMGEAEVAALIGSPDHMSKFPRTKTTTWDYDYSDAWGYDSTFSVVFAQEGVVVSKISVRKDF